MLVIMRARDMIADIIRGFSSIKQFRKKYSGAYEAMVRNGWTDLKELVVRTVPVPDNSPKWTVHVQRQA